MAETRKILGQVDLPTTTLTDVYTVPASTQSVVSTITFTNRSGANRTFRCSVAIGGEADTGKQYIRYEESLPKNTSYDMTLGITLGAGDIVRAYASGTNVSINIFGVEIA
jgi:hypothetical protein